MHSTGHSSSFYLSDGVQHVGVISPLLSNIDVDDSSMQLNECDRLSADDSV